jgi:hypothetical protein
MVVVDFDGFPHHHLTTNKKQRRRREKSRSEDYDHFN